jgi:uncharacterized membrane protein YoaT (DUF817 family)
LTSRQSHRAMDHKRTVTVQHVMCPPTVWKADMDAWWWVPSGLVAWCGVSLAVGLWLGPVLSYCAQAREALDARKREIPAGRKSRPRMTHAPPSGL